jgi:hypothetical protein
VAIVVAVCDWWLHLSNPLIWAIAIVVAMAAAASWRADDARRARRAKRRA